MAKLDGADPPGPKATIDGAEERRAAVTELIALVQQDLDHLTAQPTDMPKALAVAALARSVRLLDGMRCLRSCGLADVAPLGLRPIMESLLASLYCMLGGTSAANEMRGAHIRELSLLPKDITQYTDNQSLIDNWKGPRNRINWEHLAKRVVGGMLAQRFPGERNSTEILKRFYDGLYRAESAMTIHSGVGSFGGHIVHEANVTRIQAERYTHDDGTGALLMGGALVGLAAHFLYAGYGIGLSILDEVRGRISDGLDVNSLTIE